MKIKFFSVGGTIDKVYFDEKSHYEVGEPRVTEILMEANVGFKYEIEALMFKDSLDMTDADRQIVFNAVKADGHRHIVITHGTDTMVQTAQLLRSITDKVMVLTGAMSPARFKTSDAVFNVGFAAAAVQALSPGVYIAMNGRIFNPAGIRKNRERNRFEEI